MQCTVCHAYNFRFQNFILCILLSAVVLANGHSSNGAMAQGSQSEGDSSNTTVSPLFCITDITLLSVHLSNPSMSVIQIFVGGLDSDVSDEDLRQPFLEYGEVVSVKIPVGKGCGFVQFSNR